MKVKLSLLVLLISSVVSAQQFNYSLIDFTSHRINPAAVGLYNQWYVASVHREQNSGADFKIRSTALSAAYPQLFPKRGNVRGAIGLDLMNDVSGLNNSFKVREAGLSYALRIVKDETQSFNLGASMFYQTRGFDFSEINTNSQYITGRGFDVSLNSGENLIDFQQSFYRFNAGLFWHKYTTNKQKLAHIGVSAFDINQAKDSFYDADIFFNTTFFITAGFKIYSDRDLHVYPQALIANQNGTNLINVGVETTYRLDRYQSFAFKPRYLINRELVAVFEYKKENLVLGVSYDVPVVSANAANRGALEFGIKILGDVRPIRKKFRRRGRRTSQSQTRPKPIEIPEYEKKPYVPMRPVSTPIFIKDLPKLSKEKTITSVEFEYTFYFATDRSNLIPNIVNELKDIIDDMANDADYLITLEGHTDNIGDAIYNRELSEQRARSIAEYLVANGLDMSKIQVAGKGEDLPIASNDEKVGRALNRRVELRLVRYK